MRLLDWYGAEWREGDGLPWYVEVERDEKPREVARAIRAKVLTGTWASRGAAPEPVGFLRVFVEGSVRRALREAPRSRTVPLSIAAAELGVPERTLRDQIARGVRGAVMVDGRRGRELGVELDVGGPVRVRLPRPAPDPRRAAA